MNIIKYNSVEIPLPTPYVEIKKENVFENKRYGEIFNIKLNGQLLSEFTYAGGLYPPYQALMYKQKYLLDIFSKNWGKLEILEEKADIDSVIISSSCTDSRPYIKVNDYVYNKFNLTSQLEEFIIFNGTNWILSNKSIGGGYTYNFNNFPVFNNGSTLAIGTPSSNPLKAPWLISSWANGTASSCLPVSSSYNKFNISNSILIKEQALIVSSGVIAPGINPSGKYLLQNSLLNGKPWYSRPGGQVPIGQDAILRMIYTNQGWIIQYNLNNWFLLISATNVSNNPWEATWPNNMQVSLDPGGLLNLDGNEFIRASSDLGSLNYRKITWANGSLKPNTLYNFYYRNSSDVYTLAAAHSTSSPDLSMFDLSAGTCGQTLTKSAPAGNFEYNILRGVYRSDENGSCTIWMVSPLTILCFDNLINYGKADLTAATVSNPALFYLREIKQYDTIFSEDQILVKSISFPKASYKGLINYSIELESAFYNNNVKNISNQYNFSESKNGIVEVNHQVSAQGLNTSSSLTNSNALQNAINFVRNYTGINLVPSGYFTQGKNYILLESKEYIDHTNSSYSIEEIFSSTNLANSGVLNYTVDIISGKGSEALKIDLRGNLSCGKTYNIENVQNNIKPIDFIKNYYSGYINPVPIEYSLIKDLNKNELNFNYTFDNLNVPNPFVKYSINKNIDKINEITNLSININFQTRGNYKVILLNGEAFLSDASNQTAIQMPVSPDALASGIYAQNPEYNQGNRRLTLLNTSKITNFYQNMYEYQLSYTDKIVPVGFKDASYSFQYELPLRIYKPTPCIEGSDLYVFQDFNIKSLGKLKINADLSINKDTTWNNIKPINMDSGLFLVTSENVVYNKNIGSIKYNIDGIRKFPYSGTDTIFDITIN